MDDRKQTGKNPGKYLCSGLVYCQCGEKMHVCGAPDRKGGQYHYYYCKKHCGAPVVRVSQVDKAVKDYLAQEPMQMKIAQFLRSYKDHRRDCRESFDAALQKQIAAKEQEYDTLMQNMSVMVLAPDILSDIHEKMKTIKEEIKVLENTTPPEEYSTDVILDSSNPSAPPRTAGPSICWSTGSTWSRTMKKQTSMWSPHWSLFPKNW